MTALCIGSTKFHRLVIIWGKYSLNFIIFSLLEPFKLILVRDQLDYCMPQLQPLFLLCIFRCFSVSSYKTLRLIMNKCKL